MINNKIIVLILSSFIFSACSSGSKAPEQEFLSCSEFTFLVEDIMRYRQNGVSLEENLKISEEHGEPVKSALINYTRGAYTIPIYENHQTVELVVDDYSMMANYECLKSDFATVK